jgi:hypothetical protein
MKDKHIERQVEHLHEAYKREPDAGRSYTVPFKMQVIEAVRVLLSQGMQPVEIQSYLPVSWSAASKWGKLHYGAAEWHRMCSRNTARRPPYNAVTPQTEFPAAPKVELHAPAAPAVEQRAQVAPTAQTGDALLLLAAQLGEALGEGFVRGIMRAKGDGEKS